MKRFVKPGYVLGLIAVVLAMSGSAVASSLITGKQVKNNSLTGDDIKNGTVGVADLSGSALAGMEGPRGAVGPAGPAGAPGAPGSPGLAGVMTVESTHFSLAPGAYSPANAIAQCPAGKVVIGTGFVSSIANTGFVKAYGTFVGTFMYNNTGVTATDLHVQAVCASASGAVASSARGGTSAAYERDRDRALDRVR